mmetsp:Transcript_87505/g.245729  ORF Transcript_87505/g.245729 Transcript_87505/m.245729 type:complete len:108 (-) Transcript_87505:18-341(-)
MIMITMSMWVRDTVERLLKRQNHVVDRSAGDMACHPERNVDVDQAPGQPCRENRAVCTGKLCETLVMRLAARAQNLKCPEVSICQKHGRREGHGETRRVQPLQEFRT